MTRRISSSPRRAVLIACGDHALRSALSRELENRFEVVTAGGVQEAMDTLARRSGFIATAAELAMDQPKDGYILLSAVRLLLPRCLRVLISGRADDALYVRSGVAHHLVQTPWKPGTVLSLLRRNVGS